jgi:hypothetical protein
MGRSRQAFSCKPFADGASVRVMWYSHHAAASRRFRVSDGPELWSKGQEVFVPPVSRVVTLGTSPQSGTFQWGTSSGKARRGGNRFKRFRAGLGPGQCSQLFWRILAEIFTTPRHNNLWLVQGRNQDCRVRLYALPPPGGE